MNYNSNNREQILSLQKAEVVTTYIAATLLFPKEQITKTHIRRVQRLCKLNLLEYYKFGRNYRISKQSIANYIEANHSYVRSRVYR